MEPEVIRPIPGFDGYLVSSHGRVYSQWKRNGRGTPRWYIDKTLLHHCVLNRANRYLGLTIKRNDKRLYRTVHTLVLLAFVGPRPLGRQARHLDGDCHNNVLSNLAWGSPQENTDDKRRHGTLLTGVSHPCAKLTVKEVQAIRQRLETGETLTAVAARYGVNTGTIHRIKVGRTWKCVP